MAKASSQKHTITVCTDCRITGKPCGPGLDLLARLNDSLAALGGGLDPAFSVEGTVCMAGCARPCTIAFQASGKATYLFGDIKADRDIDELVAFAALYADRPDGMTRSGLSAWPERQDAGAHSGGRSHFGICRNACPMSARVWECGL